MSAEHIQKQTMYNNDNEEKKKTRNVRVLYTKRIFLEMRKTPQYEERELLMIKLYLCAMFLFFLYVFSRRMECEISISSLFSLHHHHHQHLYCHLCALVRPIDKEKKNQMRFLANKVLVILHSRKMMCRCDSNNKRSSRRQIVCQRRKRLKSKIASSQEIDHMYVHIEVY